MSTKGDRAAASTALVLIPQREDGEPYTTSEIIAEGSKVKHHALQQLIARYE